MAYLFPCRCVVRQALPAGSFGFFALMAFHTTDGGLGGWILFFFDDEYIKQILSAAMNFVVSCHVCLGATTYPLHQPSCFLPSVTPSRETYESILSNFFFSASSTVGIPYCPVRASFL